MESTVIEFFFCPHLTMRGCDFLFFFFFFFTGSPSVCPCVYILALKGYYEIRNHSNREFEKKKSS